MIEKSWNSFSLFCVIGMTVNYVIWKWFADVFALLFGCVCFGLLFVGLWALQKAQTNQKENSQVQMRELL